MVDSSRHVTVVNVPLTTDNQFETLIPATVVVDEFLVVHHISATVREYVSDDCVCGSRLDNVLMPELVEPARLGLRAAFQTSTLLLSPAIALKVGAVEIRVVLQTKRLPDSRGGGKRAMVMVIEAGASSQVSKYGPSAGATDESTRQIVESEERIRLANEAAGIGTFAIDVKTGIAHYSPELTALLGFPDAATVTLEQAFARIHRDDLPRVLQLFNAAQNPESDGKLQMEFRFVAPGGVVRWLRWHGRFHFAETPSARAVDRIVGVCVDVTLRKKAEEALHASEARYRSVVEGSLQGIVIQQDEKIVYANPAMARIFGFESAQDLLGKSTFDDFVAPEERGPLRIRTLAASRGETIHPHPGWRGFRTDGREIYVSTMAHSATWRGNPAVVSFYVDITERKRAEQRLSETLRLVQLACAAGQMGTWHFAYETLVPELSDESLALLGISKSKWDRSLSTIANAIHPDDRTTWRSIVDRSIATKSDVEVEFRIVRPDSQIRWMLARGTVVRTRGADEALGVLLDISDTKHAEERQNILLRELDHRVKNALANIQLVIERAHENASSLDDFKKMLHNRLMSMSMTHSRLSEGGWTGVSLTGIIQDALAPYANDSNTSIEGEDVVLTPKASQAIAMVTFELATNAAKYGALVAAPGQVLVRWQLERDLADITSEQPTVLSILWEEVGGPDVVPSGRTGYGTRVITELIPYELKGSICRHEIKTSGAKCLIQIPARYLVQRKTSSGGH